MRLHLEALEDRSLLTVIPFQSGTILTLIALPGSPHNVLVRPTVNVAGSVDVLADGTTQSYTGLTLVNFMELAGRNGLARDNNLFTNRTTLPGLLTFGNGNEVVYTIAPKTTVNVGNGNDVLQVTGGNSSIFTGSGNNSIYGGPGDTIQAGNGNNVIYDILPGATKISVDPHTGVDHLFIGPQTVLTGAQPQDHVAQFFVTAPLGSGTLAQSGSTLYFAATNAGNTFQTFDIGPGTVFVLYNLNAGAGTQFATFFGVNQIAAFGGSGNDMFINNTSIDDVMYGAGGSNTLVGGFGQLDLEKAGGQAATGSVAVGRSPVANDLNGSGLTSTSNTLIFAGGPTAQNIARTNSPTDVVMGLKATDILVSLYPDFVVAALLPPWVPA